MKAALDRMWQRRDCQPGIYYQVLVDERGQSPTGREMQQVIKSLRVYCDLGEKSLERIESILEIDSYKHKQPWTAADLTKKPLQWYLGVLGRTFQRNCLAYPDRPYPSILRGSSEADTRPGATTKLAGMSRWVCEEIRRSTCSTCTTREFELYHESREIHLRPTIPGQIQH